MSKKQRPGTDQHAEPSRTSSRITGEQHHEHDAAEAHEETREGEHSEGKAGTDKRPEPERPVDEQAQARPESHRA